MNNTIFENKTTILNICENYIDRLRKNKIYVKNLSEEFKNNRIEKVHFREEEYKYSIISLFCNRKNSLIITGESGVGKTSFVHYLSKYINEFMPNYDLIEINISNLISDSSYRGEFEKKINILMEESKNSNVIIYLDEAHTLSMTSGKNTGGIDAINMLKPYLTGDVRLILTTTTEEYALLKNDIAFNRRFRYLHLNRIDSKHYKDILLDKFKDYHFIVNKYLSENNLSNKTDLHEIIDDIDFIISQHNLFAT